MSLRFIYGQLCNACLLKISLRQWTVIVFGGDNWLVVSSWKAQNDKSYISKASPPVVSSLPETSFRQVIAVCGNPNTIYPLDNDIYLPRLWSIAFQTPWREEQHFVKMGSPPESTPAKRQESKSLSHTRQSPARRLGPSQSEEVLRD